MPGEERWAESRVGIDAAAIEVRIASASHHGGRISHSFVRRALLLIVALQRMFCPSCGSLRPCAAVRKGPARDNWLFSYRHDRGRDDA
jgi:hypothetical protein